MPNLEKIYLVVFPCVNDKGNIAIGWVPFRDIDVVENYVELHRDRPNAIISVTGWFSRDECPELEEMLQRSKKYGEFPALEWVINELGVDVDVNLLGDRSQKDE